MIQVIVWKSTACCDTAWPPPTENPYHPYQHQYHHQHRYQHHHQHHRHPYQYRHQHHSFHHHHDSGFWIHSLLRPEGRGPITLTHMILAIHSNNHLLAKISQFPASAFQNSLIYLAHLLSGQFITVILQCVGCIGHYKGGAASDYSENDAEYDFIAVFFHTELPIGKLQYRMCALLCIGCWTSFWEYIRPLLMMMITTMMMIMMMMMMLWWQVWWWWDDDDAMGRLRAGGVW